MNKNKKLKLTKLTVSNLERIKGGDPVCACFVYPNGSSDEAYRHGGGIPTFVKTQCGCGTG